MEDKSLSEDEVVKKFDAITNKAKVKAFGKSKRLTKKAETPKLGICSKLPKGWITR